MAQRFHRPIPQFYDDAGRPREGARLFFYESGTSTKLNTYSDSGLSSLNQNPMTLDEFGEPENSIFLKNQDYKVVLAEPGSDDPPSNVLRTWDPVRGSDFSLFPKWTAISGNPNGVLAGTAGSSGVLPDKAWDYANNIEYTCTTTGPALTAVWTALNSTSNASFFKPAGRLTPTSGAPVIASEVTGGTAVYYTPFEGNAAPIYNGTTFVMTTFTELTLTLHSSHSANSIYDVFLFNNSGVLTLATGPAWTTVTAGAGARGSGAGTTQLARVLGLYTNAVAISAARNGVNTYAIGANLGLYLGSIWIDGSAGQVTCHTTFGQSRKFGIWNAFNRKPILLQAGDSTGNWTYNTATIRASNNAAANKLSVLCGLPEEPAEIRFAQNFSTNASAGSAILTGIGVNSTTVMSGLQPNVAQGNSGVTGPFEAIYAQAPFIGINDYQSLEKGAATATTTFYGGAANMMLAARWRG